ncbi:MAG: hypothetical protein ACREUC_15385 [Steroidobacteraceae bacterium]
MPSQAARPLSKLALACAAILTLAACDRAGETAAPSTAATEISWARAALERNPRLEVVASDAAAGVFTVRDRHTGEVHAIKLSEIAAVPVSQLKSLDSRPAATAAAEPSPELDQSDAPSSTAANESRAAAAQPSEQVASASGTGQVQAGSGNYTIERTGGQLRVSGPGVSIVSAGPAGSSNATEGRQRTVEPIICEGRRMMHFDSRDIYVDGDAITVRGGCEIYITNSRIVASGTGIVVQNAVVHISNSHIEGASGSFDADDRAKLFVRSSTFQGVPRRTELAMVQDQGGNRWR